MAHHRARPSPPLAFRPRISTSPKGAAEHSEGLPSLGEATLVPANKSGKQTQHSATPHAHQQRLQKTPPHMCPEITQRSNIIPSDDRN